MRHQFWRFGECWVFIVITHRSTQTQNGSICLAPINVSNRSFRKLLELDGNNWNHITVCKLFVLRILNWSNNCLQRIIIYYLRLIADKDWNLLVLVWMSTKSYVLLNKWLLKENICRWYWKRKFAYNHCYKAMASMDLELRDLVWFGLLCFYGISTIVGYLIPNPFLYI